MLVSAPLIYFPTYFIFKNGFQGAGPRRAMRDYFSPSGWDMVRKYWMVWIPVDIVMWLVCPPHLRIAFLCVFSLFWQVLLSTLSYRPRGLQPASRAHEALPAVPNDDTIFRRSNEDPFYGRERPPRPAYA